MSYRLKKKLFKPIISGFAGTVFVATSSREDEYVVVCYYTSWSQYGGGVEANRYYISHIDPTLCTHIVYSFAAFDTDGTIKTIEWNDLTL